jgi:ATP-binding cassette, subfamily B, bacterial
MDRSRQGVWSLLATYLRPQRLRVALLSVLLLGSIGLQLVNPQILRVFIDRATQGVSGGLVGIALGFIVIALVAQIVTVAATYLSEQVGWSATNRLRRDLALHCLRLDMPFHNVRTPGEMIERVDGDITALSQFFSQFVIRILGSGLLMIGLLVLFFLEDWRIGLAMLLFTIVSVAVLTLTRNVAVPAMKAERESLAGLFGFVEERLAGLDDLRANGAGNYTMLRMHQRLREVYHTALRAIRLGSTIHIATLLLAATGYALALGMGAYLYRAGLATIGTVYLFFDYVHLLRTPVQQLADQLKEFQKAMAGLERVQELTHLAPIIADGDGPPLAHGPLAVEFHNVSFGYDSHPGYDSSPGYDSTASASGTRAPSSDAAPSSIVHRRSSSPVLRDVSFTLQPGTILGLLGRTGSGKTTMTRLLFRLYETTSGTIALDGTDIRHTRLADLRDRIGIVTQDVQLFQASVRDNLTLFDPSINDERMLTVLRDLGLEPWLRGLPHGLDSEIQPTSLSSGEAQLLAFARVFLKDPGLVILDEASSRLDPATELLVERAIDKLLQGRTAIIIAHRLSTVQRADEMLILDHGQILEHGERRALLRDPDSHFARLMQTGMEQVLA